MHESPTNKSDKPSALNDIRVAYIIDNLRREGTQTALVNLVEGLVPRGYRCRVYCLNDSHPDNVSRLQSHGAEVVVYGKWQTLSLVGPVRLFTDLLRWRPHVLQTQLFTSDISGRVLGALAGVPVRISSIRGINSHKQPWQFVCDRLTVSLVHTVTLNSPAAIPFAQAFEGVRPDQTVYIPNGIKLVSYDYMQARADVLAELGLPPDITLLGVVGRLETVKGHMYLIDAFAHLAYSLPNTILLIIGDGSLRAELEVAVARHQLTERVRFLGIRRDVPRLLVALDLCVHPSLREGMPNAIMEAMAAGCPVVASDVGGIKELLIDGESGWLVPPQDSTALAAALQDALTNRAEAHRRGAAAARRVMQYFSFDAMVQSYDELYRRLLSSKGIPSV
jgi:glycosyltransferase involved in cell wall biosynthesis